MNNKLTLVKTEGKDSIIVRNTIENQNDFVKQLSCKICSLITDVVYTSKDVKFLTGKTFCKVFEVAFTRNTDECYKRWESLFVVDDKETLMKYLLKYQQETGDLITGCFDITERYGCDIDGDIVAEVR